MREVDHMSMCADLINGGSTYDDFMQALIIAANYVNSGSRDPNWWHLGALAKFKLRKYDEALKLIESTYKMDPNNPQVINSKAVILKNCGRKHEALKYYKYLLKLDSQNPAYQNNIGSLYNEMNEQKLAIEHYEKALEINPDYVEALSNYGKSLCEAHKFKEGVEICERAIKLKENFAAAYLNLGMNLFYLGKKKEAFDATVKCLELDPKEDEGFKNLGKIQRENKQYLDAIDSFKKAIILNPKNEELLFLELFYAEQSLGIWVDYDKKVAKIRDRIKKKQLEGISSFLLNSIPSITIEELWKVTRRLVKKDVYQRIGSGLMKRFNHVPYERRSRTRLKIGFFSADFRLHPVSALTYQFLKGIDRNKFEVVGYSYGPGKDTEIRKKMESAFDSFIDMEEMDPEQTAKTVYGDQPDILFDLTGYTQFSRSDLLALKLAPIQVNYLGFLGTLGMDEVDYIIVDEIVAPPKHSSFYSESLVYMPICFQINDNSIKIDNTGISRESLGIPEGFVFASFNQTYKINPPIFDIWCELLREIPRSSLYLYLSSEEAKPFFIEELKKRQVENSRVIFGKNIPIEKHLARIRLCDLVLDSTPYNMGTTASNASYAGVPSVTMLGDTFLSRQGASIISASNISECVAKNPQEYYQIAKKMATDKKYYESVKSKMVDMPLFDTTTQIKNFENFFCKAWEIYLSGKSRPKVLKIS